MTVMKCGKRSVNLYSNNNKFEYKFIYLFILLHHRLCASKNATAQWDKCSNFTLYPPAKGTTFH